MSIASRGLSITLGIPPMRVSHIPRRWDCCLRRLPYYAAARTASTMAATAPLIPTGCNCSLGCSFG